MRRMLVIALVVGFMLSGWSTPATGARDDAAVGPLVGSWLVEVEFAGQPPLQLPNLVSFTSDGIVTVATPTLLPETPDSGGSRNLFRAGQGAWRATGEAGADVRFIFLVVDERGNPVSINIVDGHLEVDKGGESYTGEFTLMIASATGENPPATSGSWRATRISPGGTAIAMPEESEAIATPAT